MASPFVLSARLVAPPGLSLRFVPVWRRNLLVWRKLAFASILGNIADPLLYMLALGYGLGALVGEVGGMPYVAFIGSTGLDEHIYCHDHLTGTGEFAILVE